MRTVIQICANREWRSAKAILKPTGLFETPYGEYFQVPIGNHDVLLFHCGVTKTLAAGGCQFAISRWNPELLVCIGTCGGVSEELKFLDLILASKTVQYDCIERMDPTASAFYDEMVTDIDNSWLNREALPLAVREGTIATADQDLCASNVPMLRANSVLAVDWESGAIAKVCSVNRTRCCIVRGVTDLAPDHCATAADQQRNDYQANTPLVMEKCLSVLLPGILKQL